MKYELDDEVHAWKGVLLALDGERPLVDILRALDIPKAAIRKHLEEALDFGVVTLAGPT